MEANQQELMMKLQMFEQHMQQLQQQLQAVEQGIVDLGNLNLGLDELVNGKDKEVMSLIGKGIFAKTKLVSEELLVDVGGKNFVTKSIPETKKMIIEQLEKLNEAKSELNMAMNKVGEDFQKMIMEAQGGQNCDCGHSHEEKHECCGKHEDCECGEECKDKS
ncbi:MAG: prefoldin subunit alpha [Candidatus Pacearchaeota archaeon]|nr:prefoldin subunit alpha [Candidatus Pacearchaeota archaeon]